MAKNNKNKDLEFIEKEALSIENKDRKQHEELKEIENKVKSMNTKFKKYIGNSSIDFLNSIHFNDIDDGEINLKKNNRKAKFEREKSVSKNVLESMLDNNNILSIFDMEKARINRYEDYRLIEAYIPQVSFCLDLLRDCIMSPDDITKDSLMFYYRDKLTDNEYSTATRNIENIVCKYKLEELSKKIIRDTMMEGDKFLAIIKYEKEFNEILRNKEIENGVLNEDVLLENQINIEDNRLNSLANILIENSISEIGKKDKSERVKIFNDVKRNIRSTVVDIINENVKFNDNIAKTVSYDNLVDIESFNRQKARSSSAKNKEFKPIKMKGSIVKLLESGRVIKLQLNEIIFGYVYIETKEIDITNKSGNQPGSVPYEDIMNNASADVFSARYDFDRNGNNRAIDKNRLLADLFVDGIAKKLDREFITKNAEFKDYIYELVKTDEIRKKQISIMYLEPEEVVHFKIDEVDGYGVSKLAKSLFFATIYLATLLTEVMTKVSRGRDKRIVYVEAGLDNDLEGVVQGVVSDIKGKELSVDNLKSITSVMQTTGAFEDYFIPTIDGQKPIDFDTLSGSESEVDGDFLQFLLKSIISGMGIPYNYIEASQDVDFARTLIMQNATFVRTIVGYQKQFSVLLTEAIQKIYNNEFEDDEKQDLKEETKAEDNVIVEDIEIRFPTPIYLTMSTISEQISSASSTIDFIMQTYIDDSSSDESINDLKQSFKKAITKDMLPNIDWSKYDDIYKNLLLESKAEGVLKNSSGDSSDSGSDDMDDYDDF